MESPVEYNSHGTYFFVIVILLFSDLLFSNIQQAYMAALPAEIQAHIISYIGKDEIISAGLRSVSRFWNAVALGYLIENLTLTQETLPIFLDAVKTLSLV